MTRSPSPSGKMNMDITPTKDRISRSHSKERIKEHDPSIDREKNRRESKSISKEYHKRKASKKRRSSSNSKSRLKYRSKSRSNYSSRSRTHSHSRSRSRRSNSGSRSPKHRKNKKTKKRTEKRSSKTKKRESKKRKRSERKRSRSPDRRRYSSYESRERSRSGSSSSNPLQSRIVFVGNLPRGIQKYDLEETFRGTRYNMSVDRIDLKGSYAFVHLRGRNLDSCIRNSNPIYWHGVRLTVEFAKSNEIQKWEERKFYHTNRTLFVVNFDEDQVRQSDIEELFGKHGSLRRVSVRRNFAFVEFDELDDAQKAKEKLQGFHYRGKDLIVRYAASPDDKVREDELNERQNRRRALIAARSHSLYGDSYGNGNRYGKGGGYRGGNYGNSNGQRYRSRSRSRSYSRSGSRSASRGRRRRSPSPYFYRNRRSPSISRSRSRNNDR